MVLNQNEIRANIGNIPIKINLVSVKTLVAPTKYDSHNLITAKKELVTATQTNCPGLEMFI